MSETLRDLWSSAAAGIWPGHSELKKLGGQRRVPLYRQNHMEGARNEFLIVGGEDMTKTAQIAD
jgi:hypothetical protein